LNKSPHLNNSKGYGTWKFQAPQNMAAALFLFLCRTDDESLRQSRVSAQLTANSVAQCHRIIPQYGIVSPYLNYLAVFIVVVPGRTPSPLGRLFLRLHRHFYI
jgi:hypothetical protein